MKILLEVIWVVGRIILERSEKDLHHQECNVGESHSCRCKEGNCLIPPFPRAVVHQPGQETCERVTLVLRLTSPWLSRSDLQKNNFTSKVPPPRNSKRRGIALTSWTRWNHFELPTRSKPNTEAEGMKWSGWRTMHTPTAKKSKRDRTVSELQQKETPPWIQEETLTRL